MDNVVAQVDVRHCFSHVLQGGLVDGSAGDVVESQGRVDVVDVVQKVEEIQVVLLGNSLAVIPKTATNFALSN